MRSMNRQAPMRGLNFSDPLTNMRNGFAIRLDDWVCRTDGVVTRDGYTETMTGLGAPVTALLSYPGQLFAATAGGIFAAGGQAVSGLVSGDWMGAVVANNSGRHLVCVNGADTPRRYDGTDWDEAAITGVDGSKITTLVHHQRRIFMAAKNSLTLWYLPVDAIEGPAQPLHLEPQFKRGGQIVAVGSYSPDGGEGANSQLYVVTDQGEVAGFAGVDPDRSDKWSKLSVWKLPAPIGKRGFVKLGNRLGLMTVKGLMRIPEIGTAQDSEKQRGSASEKIDARVSAPSQVLDSESGEFTLINDGAQQWVRSDTRAWSRFTGFATATVWGEHTDGLYFGTSDGQVRKYGGDEDDGTPIRSFGVDAFHKPGGAAIKRFQRIRMNYLGAHPYVPRIELLTNYKDPPETFDAANIDSTHWLWDDVTWPRQPMPWIRRKSLELQPWRTVTRKAVCQAVMMSMQTRTRITWTDYDLTYQMGRI